MKFETENILIITYFVVVIVFVVALYAIYPEQEGKHTHLKAKQFISCHKIIDTTYCQTLHKEVHADGEHYELRVPVILLPEER